MLSEISSFVFQQTPLEIAILNKQINMAKYLIDSGADIYEDDNKGVMY